MKPVRRLPHPSRKVLYLTFDDGPDPESTPEVLQVLEFHGVLATFFVVAEKAQRETLLLRKIRSGGHAIGNHSMDHGYSRFFMGKGALRSWVRSAEESLSALLGEGTVGFRPPNGIRTPELHGVLREMKIPLVLWNTRFFDAVFKWTETRALRSLDGASSGDIILLHDRQPGTRLPMFLKTLDAYLSDARKRGYGFDVLTRKKLEEHIHA